MTAETLLGQQCLDNLITAHGLQIREEWHTVCTTKVAEYCQLPLWKLQTTFKCSTLRKPCISFSKRCIKLPVTCFNFHTETTELSFSQLKFCLLHIIDSDSDIIKAYVARNICIHDLICDDASLFTTIHWSGILILTTAWVTGKTSKIWTYIWYTKLLKYVQVVLR